MSMYSWSIHELRLSLLITTRDIHFIVVIFEMLPFFTLTCFSWLLYQNAHFEEILSPVKAEKNTRILGEIAVDTEKEECTQKNVEAVGISLTNGHHDSLGEDGLGVETPKSLKKDDIREDFFGADGYRHVKKHTLHTQQKVKAPLKEKQTNKNSQSIASKTKSINRITASEIYRDVLKSLNESFRVMNKRCKCYGPDVWLGSFPYECENDMVLLKDYRRLVTEYAYHVIQRAKLCGCALKSEGSNEKSEVKFVKKLPAEVLMHGKKDTYEMTKLDFYRSMLTLEKSMQKAIGKCCFRNTGEEDGTDPDISTCHIT